MQRALQFALAFSVAAIIAPAAHAQRPRHGGISTSGNVAQVIQGYPAPGLGFDYTHHAAVNRNLATRALIDPITQHQLAQARAIRRDAGGVVGVPVLVGGGATVVVVQQPPPTIVIQGGDHTRGRDRDYDRDSDDLDARIARLERASYSNRLTRLERLEREQMAREETARDDTSRGAAEPPARVRDPRPARYDAPRESSEIVFIRRDGTLIFAVAFAKQRERIVYISSEGHRRTLALADLDLEATTAMNEARGAEIRF